MPGDPVVVVVMRAFKRALLAREQAQMAAMATQWVPVEQALQAEISALAQDFADRRERGLSISKAALYRMDRYQSLLRQTTQQLARYETYAGRTIANGQQQLIQLGLEHAAQAISVQYPGVGAFFDRLPVEAVEHMVGLAGNGSPLARLLKAGWDEAAAGLTRELVTSTALGRNPRETARRMKRGLASGLNRTLTIARTEQLRVYRQASQQQYAASGVVRGHRRIATHDDRVCAACLMAEGEWLAVDEAVYDHPQGRCGSVPEVDGLPPVRFELGRDWLRQQDAATQQKILGKGRYRAWQDGQFDLEQLVTRQHDRTWGKSLHPTPLKQLT